jgi:hypothetical protein
VATDPEVLELADLSELRAKADAALAEYTRINKQLLALAEQRRDRLRAELAKVEKVVAEVASENAPRIGVASVPDIVRQVLAKHPTGLTSVEVIAEVQTLKPEVLAPQVHSALRNIPKKGDRRSFRYFPPPMARQVFKKGAKVR